MLNLKINNYFLFILICSIFFGLYFSWYTITRHRVLQTAYFDLGIMDQVVYNTSRGRILELSNPHGIGTIYRMAIHTDIFLALLAPFYWIWQSPEALLVIQALVVGSGAIALYLISSKLLDHDLISLLIGILYLIYPAVHGAVTYDFHAVTLSSSFIVWMVYFLLINKKLLFWVFLLIALTTKENVGFTIGVLLLIFLINSFTSLKKISWKSTKKVLHNNFDIVFAITLCFLWSFICFLVIIPFFQKGQHVALERYKDFGLSEGEIILSFFTKPHNIVSMFISRDSKMFIAKLFSPFGFIPLAGFIWLFALAPELLINLLSNNWATKQIIYHYTALMTPIIFIALIYGIKKMIQWEVPRVIIVSFLVFSSLYSWCLFGHVPFSEQTKLEKKTEYPKLAHWAKKLKDESIIVSGSNHTSPHLTQRRYFYYFPDGYEYADYIVIMTNDIYNDWRDKKASIKGYEALKKDKRFYLLEKYRRLEVYKKLKTNN